MLQKLKKMLNIQEKKQYGAYSLLNGPWSVWGRGMVKISGGAGKDSSC